MDIRSSLAAQQYAATRPATAAKTQSDGQNPIANIVEDFSTTLQAGEKAALATMSGGADAHSLVQALAQTELAVEAAITVRDKVVEAYQEILRMQV